MHPTKRRADPNLMNVTLLLRPSEALPEIDHPLSSGGGERKHLSHAEMATHHGARAEDFDLVRDFAAEHQLHIGEVDAARRTVQLTGTVEAVAEAFQAVVPLPLRHAVEAVLGLRTDPAVRRHRTPLAIPTHQPHSLRQIASAYDFPEQVDGSGQTIGVIELGGGYRAEDIAAFCEANDLPVPKISVVEVQGGRNAPASTTAIRELLDWVNGQTELSAEALHSSSIEAAQATVEVTMDLAILAGLAPSAHLVVYFGTSDEQGLYHALSRAIYDETNRPDVLSISWGESEVAMSEPLLRAMDRLLLAASHLGITVCASSGDSGARNNSPDHQLVVNFPASSPYCLACGGTYAHFKPVSGAVEIVEEIAWNATHFGHKWATGGGVSRRFPLPVWQQHARVPLGPTGRPGRGVPDVAGPSDPRCGFEIPIAGRSFTSTGTSAVAPLWAALLACCNQALGRRCGHVHDHLYYIGHRGLAGLRPVVSGHNDGYEAGPGWDACTGYGTPSGRHLQHYFQSAASNRAAKQK